LYSSTESCRRTWFHGLHLTQPQNSSLDTTLGRSPVVFLILIT
jgi:hypothetical protein